MNQGWNVQIKPQTGNSAVMDKNILVQMCYQEPRMVENLPNFYRRIVNIKDCDGKPLFDYNDLDQIVIAAQGPNFPIVTAKAWGASDSKKGEVFHGKNQDEQFEIASMTKVCTAYTAMRILEELDLLEEDKLKNIYLRTSRKAAFMTGTSAYFQTDNRVTIYDCLCGLMLPSGNDAAIILATELGRWLYLTGDKSIKKDHHPSFSNKGKLGIY